MCSLHRNHLTLILKFCRLHTNISGSIARAWLRTRLETMLFQIHFQLVVRKRFNIFFIFARNIRRKSVSSLTLFLPFTSNNSRRSTQSHPRCTGNRTLAKTFFRGGLFFLVEKFLYLDTPEKFVDLVPSGYCRNER